MTRSGRSARGYKIPTQLGVRMQSFYRLHCKHPDETPGGLPGPDAQGTYRTLLQSASKVQTPGAMGENEPEPTLALEFFASELRLRGSEPVVQPHQRDGDVLCWNGEVSLPLPSLNSRLCLPGGAALHMCSCPKIVFLQDIRGHGRMYQSSFARRSCYKSTIFLA